MGATAKVGQFAYAIWKSVRPVMIGDDRTDEAAFRAAEAAGGFGILVDPRWVSAARYGLADTRAVADWLAQLAEAAR